MRHLLVLVLIGCGSADPSLGNLGGEAGGAGGGGSKPYTGPKTYNCDDTCTCPNVSPTSCGGDMWCASDVNAANQKEKTAHPGGSCIRAVHCSLFDSSPCTP